MYRRRFLEGAAVAFAGGLAGCGVASQADGQVVVDEEVGPQAGFFDFEAEPGDSIHIRAEHMEGDPAEIVIASPSDEVLLEETVEDSASYEVTTDESGVHHAQASNAWQVRIVVRVERAS